MIKSTVISLINVLNRLDRESDTLMLIDWESRSIFLSQTLGNTIQCNEFWILFDNMKDKGRSYNLITKKKLESLKYYLIRYSNSFTNSLLVPKKLGFEIKRYEEVLYKNKFVMVWTSDCRFNFRTNPLLMLYLKVFNKYFKDLLQSMKSIRIE